MAGVGARYGGQYLVLNGPALWNTVSSYGGALLTGAAIGDRLYNEGLHLSNLPDYLTDLGPLVEGAFPKLPELPRLSGFAEPGEGGTSLVPRRGTGLRGGGGPGGPGGPGGDGEPDLLIIPPRLDKATGKIRSSVTDLRGGGTYDAEVDPITRNGTIVRRDSGEVVGNIWNGVPSPVGTDPPAGGGGTGAGTVGRAPALPAPAGPAPAVPAPAVPAPALPASGEAQPAGAPPQPRPRARGWADFLPFLDVARRSQQASQEKYGLRPEHLAMDTNATKPPASAMSGTQTKPETYEQYRQRGGLVTQGKLGESGLKDPPEPKPEITARPKERSFEEEREEKLGPAEDSPEVAANQSGRKTPGGAEPPVRAEVGNFAHNKLPGYLDKMRSELAREKFPEARAKLEQQIAELEAMTEWPAGLEPNRLSFTMSDGRRGIPDGMDVKTGKVYELKPDTKSEWAKGGDYQASEYAAKLNEMRYFGRTDWEGEVIVYKATEMTAKLRKWGVLPPEPPPKTK